MAFKMSGPSLYKGTPLKQETAETFEKNANNKAKNLRKETYAADDRGDALSANISEAGIRKTFDSPQYKAARKTAATNRAKKAPVKQIDKEQKTYEDTWKASDAYKNLTKAKAPKEAVENAKTKWSTGKKKK
jgi:hypothetical protein